MARNLLAAAAVLITAGLALANTDLALLSLIPLFAYGVNAALDPPKVSASRRRVGSEVEVVVEADRRPGVLYIYDAAPIDAPVEAPRWRVFKPPFKRVVRLRYRLTERSQPLPLVVVSYNPVFTRRRIVAYVEERRPAANPAQRGHGVEEFVEVRQYQPGDPMKLINWKASAKTGELYVNVRTGPELRNAVVVVDARRLRSLVAAEAAKAAEILSEKGFEVTYYVLGHGPATSLPGDFTPACEGNPPCGDVTVYVGSLSDVCIVMNCRPMYYVDVAGANALVALRRLALYKRLRDSGAVVLRGAEALREAL